MLPGLLLAGFASRWHKRVSSEKDLYGYKKTVAAALPGFKAEIEREDADKYTKAITAEAFERLLFNPYEVEQQSASTQEKKEGRIFRAIRELLDTRKDAAQ